MTHAFPTRRSSDLKEKGMRTRWSEGAGRARFAVIEKRHAPAKQTWSRRRRRDHRPHHPQTRRGCPAMVPPLELRSEEHTSELQSLMRISYAVFCLKKKKTNITAKKTPHNPR